MATIGMSTHLFFRTLNLIVLSVLYVGGLVVQQEVPLPRDFVLFGIAVLPHGGMLSFT